MDKNYWSLYYARQNLELQPSLFAKEIVSIVKQESHNLVELGCGNGRDAVYFANSGFNVLAIDQVEEEINFLKSCYQYLTNIRFLCADFTDYEINEKFDVVYSRFTLHSISAEQEKKVLNNAYNILNNKGYICIEARGQKNEIFKKGIPVEGEKDAFILDNHYRRFINFDLICKEIISIGFDVLFAHEDKGFAPFNGADETFIRIIAMKR